MKHAMRHRRPRHALRGRDLQREYRQAVAVADAVYQQWVDGTATYEGYIAARTAVRDLVQEMPPMSVGEYRRRPEIENPPPGSVHSGTWGWLNDAELVWECADDCPHPSHEEDDR